MLEYSVFRYVHENNNLFFIDGTNLFSPEVMTAYRVYEAKFPFEARDVSELSMLPGDQLIVGIYEDGSWPNEHAWMKGKLSYVCFVKL